MPGPAGVTKSGVARGQLAARALEALEAPWQWRQASRRLPSRIRRTCRVAWEGDGLQCFTSVTDPGCTHQVVKAARHRSQRHVVIYPAIADMTRRSALSGRRCHPTNSGTPRQICAGPRSHRHVKTRLEPKRHARQPSDGSIQRSATSKGHHRNLSRDQPQACSSNARHASSCTGGPPERSAARIARRARRRQCGAMAWGGVLRTGDTDLGVTIPLPQP